MQSCRTDVDLVRRDVKLCSSEKGGLGVRRESVLGNGQVRMASDLRRSVGRVGILALGVISMMSVVYPPTAGAVRDDANQHWVGAWAASPLPPDQIGTGDGAVLSRKGFQDTTLREIAYLHFGGARVATEQPLVGRQRYA